MICCKSCAGQKKEQPDSCESGRHLATKISIWRKSRADQKKSSANRLRVVDIWKRKNQFGARIVQKKEQRESLESGRRLETQISIWHKSAADQKKEQRKLLESGRHLETQVSIWHKRCADQK